MGLSDVIHERLRLATTYGYGMFISDEESAEVDRELDAIIESIKNCHDLESASEQLREVKLFSEILATTYYRYGITISRKQHNVVTLFDWGYPNQDLDALAFESIKAGRLTL